jgi:hypothetical protein
VWLIVEAGRDALCHGGDVLLDRVSGPLCRPACDGIQDQQVLLRGGDGVGYGQGRLPMDAHHVTPQPVNVPGEHAVGAVLDPQVVERQVALAELGERPTS